MIERIGLVWSAGAKFRQGIEVLDFHESPITEGIPDSATSLDGPYWKLPGNQEKVHPVATSQEEGEPHPQVWTKDSKPGRVVGILPGHFTWTHDDPLYRLLVFRSLLWAADQPLGRLNSVVFEGARVAD